jgi:hypothetical protein
MKETRQQLKEAFIFLEEDLHNVVLQEETTCLKEVIGKEEYVARGARFCA